MQGIFNATISDYGISETKGGLPQIWADFKFQFEGLEKTLTWHGSLKDGAKDITLKTLLILGLPQNAFSSLHFLNGGLDSKLLNTQKVFELTVEPDTYEGKTRDRIKFINDPENPTHTQKRLDQAGLAKHMNGLNFGGDLIRLANEMGVGSSNNNPGNNGGQNQGQNFNQNQGQNQNQNQMNGQNQGQQSFGNNNQQNFNNQNQGNFNQNQGQNFNQNQNQMNGQNGQSNTNSNGQQFNGNQGGNGGGNFTAPF